jgi:hypothetical protein
LNREMQMSRILLCAATAVAFVTLGGDVQSAVLRIDKPPTLGLVEPVVCVGDRRTYRNFDHCWRVLAKYPWGARHCSRICHRSVRR